MKKGLCHILCLLTIGCLLLFFVQEHWPLFKLKPLNGVTEKTEFPALTMKNCVTGNFQNDLEQYLRENFGFRECLIRFYNQYLWDCYQKTNVQSITIGKENYLYNTAVIEDYCGEYQYNYIDSVEQLRPKLVLEATRLRKVQEILAEYGKHLFVVIEPSKARVYPEYLPDKIRKQENHLTAADLYPVLFDSIGVNYINLDRWFQQIKDSVGYALYPQLGTHWSNLAALHVTDSILRYMEWLGDTELPQLQISQTLYDTTMRPDDDLEKLLNLSRSIRDIPNQYADFHIANDTTVRKPAIITIGDSYYWNIAYHIPLDSLFSRHPFWYYNNSVYYDPQYQKTADFSLIEQLVNTDFVMISFCTVNLYSMSNLFSCQALVNLCYNKQEVNRVLQKVIENIHNTDDWMAAIEKKAAEQGKSLDQVLHSEAEYVLYSNPERYFPALAENHPLTRNTMLRMTDPEDPIGITLRYMHTNQQWRESLEKKAKERNLDLETVMIQDAEWGLHLKSN
jgi:hypothetical protein